MKGFISIYVDLPEMTDEQIFHFEAYLDDKKNELYEDIRNFLTLTPADYGRKVKADHGIKKGRKVVNLPDPSNEPPVPPVEGPSEEE